MGTSVNGSRQYWTVRLRRCVAIRQFAIARSCASTRSKKGPAAFCRRPKCLRPRETRGEESGFAVTGAAIRTRGRTRKIVPTSLTQTLLLCSSLLCSAQGTEIMLNITGLRATAVAELLRLARACGESSGGGKRRRRQCDVDRPVAHERCVMTTNIARTTNETGIFAQRKCLNSRYMSGLPARAR